MKEQKSDHGNDGLKQLRDARKDITNRWARVGLLDGLSGNVRENVAKLFEGQLSYRMPQNFEEDDGWKPASQSESREIAEIEKKDFIKIIKENGRIKLSNPIIRWFKKLFFWERKERSPFSSVAFPIIKKVFGSVIGNDIVAVQPMNLPSSGLYFADSLLSKSTVVQKIIGRTPEEYLIDLINCWNQMPTPVSRYMHIAETYRYKMRALLKAYPNIVFEYCLTDYDHALMEFGEYYELEFKFPKDRPFPIEYSQYGLLESDPKITLYDITTLKNEF